MSGRFLDLTEGALGRNVGIDLDAKNAAPFAPQNASLYSYMPTLPHGLEPQGFLRDMFTKQPPRMTLGLLAIGSSEFDIADNVTFDDSGAEKHTLLLDLYGEAYALGSVCADATVERAVKEAHKRQTDRKAIWGESIRAIRWKRQSALAGFAMYEVSPEQYEGVLAVSNGVVEASKKVLLKRGITYVPEMYWPLATAIMTPKGSLEAGIERFKKGQRIKPKLND